MRFAGHKDNRVCLISDQPIIISNSNYSIVEIPDRLAHIPSSDLMHFGRIRDNKFHYSEKIEAKEMKVAFVSNWMQKCGISTFSQYLFPEISKHIKDFKLFIEKTDDQTSSIYQFGDQEISKDKVIPCWSRGQSLQELASEIKKYDPSVILIEHEFGLHSNNRYWTSFLTSLSDYDVIVELHSTFPYHEDKVLFEAPIKRAIVHLEGAKHNLEKEKNLPIQVSYIPHGCYPITNQNKLWNNYKSSETFLQLGFGFPYKNFAASIQATAILKQKYPNVFFTAIISESPHNKVGHQKYYNELIDFITKLNIQDNVGIIRGFQPDTVIDAYLRSNQAAVFPYMTEKNHFVYGSSGAIRKAASVGVPVISSSIPHFTDFPSIKANSPEDIGRELDILFSDGKRKKDQIALQNEFIKKNSFEEVAKLYIAVFENNIDPA
jgi:glycosyltransferase involved in cell wall biosynthesis